MPAKFYSREGFTAAVKHLPPLDCTGCNACCMNGQLLPLLPGDDPELYDTETIYPPDDPDNGILCLKTGGSGDGCLYCNEAGCGIYETRPKICREFDCRGLVLINTRNALQEGLSQGLFTKAIIQAGRDRLRKYRRLLP